MGWGFHSLKLRGAMKASIYAVLLDSSGLHRRMRRAMRSGEGLSGCLQHFLVGRNPEHPDKYNYMNVDISGKSLAYTWCGHIKCQMPYVYRYEIGAFHSHHEINSFGSAGERRIGPVPSVHMSEGVVQIQRVAYT